MPIVSVIIPTYNRCSLLKAALESIFAQTVKDIEIILIDDGSNDGTLTYLKSVTDTRIKVINTLRTGAAQSRNIGIKEATGKYIAFCDSDDVWFPEKLERQLALFESDEPPLLVFGDARIMEGEKVTEQTVFSTQKPSRGDVFQLLLLDNFVPTSTVIFNKESFHKTPGFEMAFCPSEDYGLWLNLAKMGRFDFVKEEVAYYRRHKNQASRDLTVMFPACVDVINNALLQSGLRAEDVPKLGMRLWQLHFVAARKFMEKNQPHRARRHYGLANRYRKYSQARIFYWLSYLGL